MRPESEESKYRAGRRKQYFENPKYRKWSDIIDKTNRSYGTYRERAFLRLYLDCNEVSDNLSLSKMHETLANGKNQPIGKPFTPILTSEWTTLIILMHTKWKKNFFHL